MIKVKLILRLHMMNFSFSWGFQIVWEVMVDFDVTVLSHYGQGTRSRENKIRWNLELRAQFRIIFNVQYMRAIVNSPIWSVFTRVSQLPEPQITLSKYRLL